MPLKNKEDRKEYNRLYKINNKEQIRLYNINNKEKKKEYDKEWMKTEKGKKINRINTWKNQGMLCFDWNLLYDLFLSTTKCEFCDIKLTIDRYTTSTTRCLDHDHSINDKFNIRGVLCHSCNRKDVLK